MKKNIGLMALTGILTLASCGQNGSSADTTAPTSVVLNASPQTLASNTGGAVTLSGTAADNVGDTKVTVSGGTTTLTCTVTGTMSASYTCPADTLLTNTSTTSAKT